MAQSSTRKTAQVRTCPVRAIGDGTYYFHTGSTRRVRYGRELQAAMDNLRKLTRGA